MVLPSRRSLRVRLLHAQGTVGADEFGGGAYQRDGILEITKSCTSA